MRIQEVMTRHVTSVRPSDTVIHAARMMETESVGFLPVIENDRLCGVITDRDIMVGCDAHGRDAHHLRVDGLMTRQVRCCHEDDEVDDVLAMMAREHLRRVPVLMHRNTPQVVGIVSIDDLADESARIGLVGNILKSRQGPHS